MLHLFADNLLPVFLAAGAGFALAALGKVDPRPLARAGFYIFSPCLVYQVIVENHVAGTAFAHMAGFALVVLLGLGAVAALVGRLLRWPRTTVAAVVLTVALPNAGNYGLSANLFAFGNDGLAQASLFFVTSAVLSYTFGVFVASLGRMSLRRALIALPRVPAIWAVAVAFLIVRSGATVPFPAARTLKLLADACIPVFLVILGMQLYGAAWRGRLGPLATASSLRLVGGMAAGLAVAALLGLDGPARQAGVLEASMPAAVINIILASEYDLEPAFVTAIVTVTTVLSPLTLTPLLAYLGA